MSRLETLQKFSSTVEQAMAHLAKKENPPRFSLDRERAELAMKKVEGGFVLTRDPDQKNTQSQAPGASLPKYTNVNSWDALGEIKCPVTFIRGKRSDRNKPEHYARIAREFPQIRVETIDSRHDIAFEAPKALIETVNRVMIDQSCVAAPGASHTATQASPEDRDNDHYKFGSAHLAGPDTGKALEPRQGPPQGTDEL